MSDLLITVLDKKRLLLFLRRDDRMNDRKRLIKKKVTLAKNAILEVIVL